MSNKQTNKQTHIQTNEQEAKIKQTKQTDRLERREVGGGGRWVESKPARHSVMQAANTQTDRHGDRQIDRHATDRQTDRQRNGQARDRQIERPRGRQEGGKLEKYKLIKRR